MDWVAALLLGLLGGGTIGAIATALLTVSHERAERFRDRQFEAASRFIAEYEASLTATTEFWEAQTNLTFAMNDAMEASGPAHEALKEAVGIKDVVGELRKAMNVGLDLMARDFASEYATEEISRARAVLEKAIDSLSGRTEEPFASTSRDLLLSLQRSSETLAQVLTSSKRSREGLHRLLVSVAQLNLLFANEDAEVVEAARQVAEALVALTGRVLGLALDGGEEPEEESDDISDQIQDVNQLLADFAALANARVRPRPLLRELA